MSEHRDIEKLLYSVDFTRGSSHKERLRKKLFEKSRPEVYPGGFRLAETRKEKRIIGNENNRLEDEMLVRVAGGETVEETIPDKINGVPVSKDGNCPYCGCTSTDEYVGQSADGRLDEYTCYDCGKYFWKRV